MILVVTYLTLYPTEYPFKPPKVTYKTNDGFTRFNPNLYKNGKVCISLLNTWQGEQWLVVKIFYNSIKFGGSLK